MIIKPTLLLFLFMVFFVSCNNEELFIEPTAEVVVDPEPDTTVDPDTPVEDNNAGAVDTSLPCSFALDAVQSGDTIVINCVMDLGGQTINLPANVTIVYEGGDVINGTLNFASNTVISGELLNSSLTLSGASPQMKDTSFTFNPQRWGIVEGVVSDEVAKRNKDILKSLLVEVNNLGITTFSIDKLDAFFKVDRETNSLLTPTQFAINIPSNFTLSMTENTHLRIQPNNFKEPILLSVLDASNVVISGGILHGDRDEHDYSNGGTHEWETLVSVKSGKNIKIENVTVMDSSGDGMNVSGLGHAFSTDYNPSVNVTLTGNKFIRNRRNNLSIVDGHEIIVENNEFIDAGIHTNKSEGTAPGFAIDVEAVRGGDGTIYQIAEDIIIRNNIEKGSRVGGFTVHTGDRVTIESNLMESSISYSTSIGTIIRNNEITAVSDLAKTNGTAISAGRNDRFERNYGNKVYGNTVFGFSTGMKVSNTDLEVYDNDLIDCKVGLSFEVLTNSKIYNNKIISSVSSSDGILSAGQSKYLDKVVFSNNRIEVTRTPLQFVSINNDAGEENYSYTIEKNIINKGGITMSNSNGFILDNNNLENGNIRLSYASKGSLTNNILNVVNNHGIRIDSGCKDLVITNNDISVNNKYECVWENNTDSINIKINNNICN
ncbi:MAG: right-handed parallel beta-helix repeat-containing protein [Flavobacteriaceae bacterium]|nr:right-handed parallel beta-helix repeat-containing protein [Flavobacteriaceae bacterium]